MNNPRKNSNQSLKACCGSFEVANIYSNKKIEYDSDSDVENVYINFFNSSDEFSDNTRIISNRKINKAFKKMRSYKIGLFSRLNKSKPFGKPNKMIYANLRHSKYNYDNYDI
jgi:hypothetical protein